MAVVFWSGVFLGVFILGAGTQVYLGFLGEITFSLLAYLRIGSLGDGLLFLDDRFLFGGGVYLLN